jgi:hypothetical protein
VERVVVRRREPVSCSQNHSGFLRLQETGVSPLAGSRQCVREVLGEENIQRIDQGVLLEGEVAEPFLNPFKKKYSPVYSALKRSGPSESPDSSLSCCQ